jgi:inosine-uridine nucleoside N-ribohydrolase
MPESGSIKDTDPIGSPGTQSIINAARDASTENPLAVAVGGPLCTVADAYLTDPSIRDKIASFVESTRSPTDGMSS